LTITAIEIQMPREPGKIPVWAHEAMKIANYSLLVMALLNLVAICRGAEAVKAEPRLETTYRDCWVQMLARWGAAQSVRMESRTTVDRLIEADAVNSVLPKNSCRVCPGTGIAYKSFSVAEGPACCDEHSFGRLPPEKADEIMFFLKVPSDLRTYERFLKSDLVLARRCAAKTIESFLETKEEAEVVQMLEASLADADELVRVFVLEALLRSGHQTQKYIGSGLSDKSISVLNGVVNYLNREDVVQISDDNLRLLVKLLSKAELKEAVHRALKKFTKKDFGTDKTSWLQWVK
jgi:hypothetical protein